MKLPQGCERKNDAIICKIKDNDVEMKSCEWQLGHGSSCTTFRGETYPLMDVIFPIVLNESRKMETKGYGIIKTSRRFAAYNKDLYLVGKIGDLGETGDTAVIVNQYARDVIVRKIKVEKDYVLIDAADGNIPLRFPKDLDVYYETWFMDKGSFIFINPSGNDFPKGHQLKIATEGDIMMDKPLNKQMTWRLP